MGPSNVSENSLPRATVKWWLSLTNTINLTGYEFDLEPHPLYGAHHEAIRWLTRMEMAALSSDEQFEFETWFIVAIKIQMPSKPISAFFC